MAFLVEEAAETKSAKIERDRNSSYYQVRLNSHGWDYPAFDPPLRRPFTKGLQTFGYCRSLEYIACLTGFDMSPVG